MCLHRKMVKKCAKTGYNDHKGHRSIFCLYRHIPIYPEVSRHKIKVSCCSSGLELLFSMERVWTPHTGTLENVSVPLGMPPFYSDVLKAVWWVFTTAPPSHLPAQPCSNCSSGSCHEVAPTYFHHQFLYKRFVYSRGKNQKPTKQPTNQTKTPSLKT